MPIERIDSERQMKITRSVMGTLERESELQFRVLTKISHVEGDLFKANHNIYISGWNLEEPSQNAELRKILSEVHEAVSSLRGEE